MKPRIIKISLFIFANFLMIALIFLLLLKNDVFVLKAVKIYGNRYVSKSEIFEKVRFNYSENIFKIDIDKIEEIILEHPMIEQVRISRFYPSILKVKVKEYDVLAGVAGSEIAAISIGGFLIHDYNPEVIYDLPIITGIHFYRDSLNIRQPQNPELLNTAIKILRTLKQKDPILFNEISELNFNSKKGMIFILRTNNISVLFGKDHFIRKLNYFSTIFNNLFEKHSLNNILALDLAFKLMKSM